MTPDPAFVLNHLCRHVHQLNKTRVDHTNEARLAPGGKAY